MPISYGELRKSEVKKGFTIIEVVLVLAIGGLIFLMVFVALPAFQRSQRNLQRKNDLDRVFSAIVDFQSNNKGRLPADETTGELLIHNYIDKKAVLGESNRYSLMKVDSCSDAFVDPDGECYNLYICPWGSWVPKPRGAYCNIKQDIEEILSGGNPYLPAYTILMYHRTKCGVSEGDWEYVDKSNSFALYYVLEGGQVHCIDNS